MMEFGALRKMLNGDSVGEQVEHCDVDLDSNNTKLVLKQNVCYIVAGILFNERNEVLMVQEAKASCYEKWYLPAGRMEPNETIVEAVQREVLEEAGLEFEPEGILCIEECGGSWIRFTLTGRVTGGKLKTTEDADAESLQAMWWNREDEIPIRCKDILHLIDLGFEKQSNSIGQKTLLLPALQQQKLIFLRTLVIHQEQSDGESPEAYNSCSFLLKTEGSSLVPLTTRIHLNDFSFRKSVNNLLRVSLGIDGVDCQKPCVAGVLGVEHVGRSSSGLDGIGFNVIVDVTGADIPKCKENFRWIKLPQIEDSDTVTLLSEKLTRLRNEQLLPLFSLQELRSARQNISV